jgi:hypothetical protein
LYDLAAVGQNAGNWQFQAKRAFGGDPKALCFVAQIGCGVRFELTTFGL